MQRHPPWGALTHARQVLVAPCNQATLDALQDAERRPLLPLVVLCAQTLCTTCPSDHFNWTNTSSVGIFDRPGGEQQQVRPVNDHGTHAPFVGRCEGIAFILLDGESTWHKRKCLLPL